MAPEERKIDNLEEQMETIEIQDRGYDVNLWSLYLWNDESHSFQEVIDEVMESMEFSDNDAKNVAETVDRIVLFFSF
jgi:hypothetical protein